MSDWTEQELYARNPDLAALNQQASERGEDRAGNVEARETGVSSPSKYHAVRTNGYASKKEADYAAELDLQVKAGEIDFWLPQVAFPLPGGVIHKVDFVTFKATVRIYSEDKRYGPYNVRFIEVKGKDLPMGRLKRRQVEELYGIRITVV